MKSLHALVARINELSGVQVSFEKELPIINGMPLAMEFNGQLIRLLENLPDRDKLWMISHAYGHCYQWSKNPFSRDEDPAELPLSASEFIDILTLAFNNEKEANEVGLGTLIRVTDCDTFDYCLESLNKDWINFSSYLCSKYSLRNKEYSMLTGLDFREVKFSPVIVRSSGAYIL